jgi:hypothetical protein
MILQLPTSQEPASWIKKLEGNAGSVVLIAVEQPEVCNFASCRSPLLRDCRNPKTKFAKPIYDKHNKTTGADQESAEETKT